MKYYLIYKITNLINNKIYIGKHITNNIDDSYMGSGKLINLAIKKYGIQFFKKEILFQCSTEDEMNQKEAEIVNEEFIARLDTYNMHVGGKGGWNHINNDKNYHLSLATKGGQHYKNNLLNMTDDEYESYCQKLSMSISALWKKNGHNWLGRHHSEETKAKMRASRYDGHGKNNSQFGTMWICNDETNESKKILKTDSIPDGWRKGRICKKRAVN